MIKKFLKKYFKKYNPRAKKLQKEGVEILSMFSREMAAAGIDWWLEFGSLLGMYRDNDFIKGDFDIDFGANLADAEKITGIILRTGCTLHREYHVVGEFGMEQTFKAPSGLNFDIFYMFRRGDVMIGNGFRRYQGRRRHRPSFFCVSESSFKPFSTIETDFKGVKVRIPANTEEHIAEVYGPGYKVYDPLFKDGYNKTKFSAGEKIGIGFMKGLKFLK